MALNELYIVASDLEQYFVDKDSGLPLSNGTLTFFRDNARNVPKPVFQLSGSPPNYTYTSMGAQITLSAVGTVQNSGGDNEVIYYYPWIVNADGELELDLYYVVCRDENGIEQFTREAWPNVTASNDPTKDDISVQNQIANPTFTNVFINQPATPSASKTTTYTATGSTDEVFAFAPDWDFVISGTGTVVIERIAISGNDNVVTSPPYILDISVSSGITKCYLRQRFNVNSGLWASTAGHEIFLAGSFVARNESGGSAGIQMLYEESSGGSQVVIVDALFQNTYAVQMGTTAAAIPVSTNTDLGENGYVDILLSFNPLSHVRITSIQVIPVTSTSITVLPFDTNSSNREEAFQGDYYIPQLIQKTIPSFLTGWDFPVAPYQFALSGNIATTAAYITDQTIALRGATGNVAWAISSITRGLQFTTAGTDDAFYMLQYLTGAEVKRMIGSKLAVNVFAFQGAANDPVTMKVYLCRGSSAATIPTLPTSIGTIAADGTFTLSAANWTLIERSGLDTAEATLAKLTTNDQINNGNYDYGFSQWEITDATQIGDTDKFAIVVTFQYADATTVITVNSVSVIPGELPCRPAVKTFEETLADCQFYFEKSYNNGVFTGAASVLGSLIAEAVSDGTSGISVDAYALPFGFDFNTIKRTIPTLFIYSVTGTVANVTTNIYNNYTIASTGNTAITFWGISIIGEKHAYFVPTNGSTIGGTLTSPVVIPFSIINFHYVADARLGVV